MKENDPIIKLTITKTDGTQVIQEVPQSQLGSFVNGLTAAGFSSLTGDNLEAAKDTLATHLAKMGAKPTVETGSL